MDNGATPTPAVRKYRGLGKPVVFFEPMEGREDGAIGIYSTPLYLEGPGGHPETDLIGILIPEAQGFRLAMSKPPHNDDIGGGLIFVWNGGPVSMRFDVITHTQRELDLLSGGSR